MNSENTENKQQPLAEPTYDVGYGRPPKSNWFPPGASDNPAGRPKGAKNKLTDDYLSNLLLEEIYRPVKIEGSKDEPAETISSLRAAARARIKLAVGGHYQAAQWLFLMSEEIENDAVDEEEADYVYAQAHKERWRREIACSKSSGRFAIPQPVPHPDHIILDPRRREVTFIGPRNEEERAEYDAYLAEQAKSSDVAAVSGEDTPPHEPPREVVPGEEISLDHPPLIKAVSVAESTGAHEPYFQ